MIRFQDPLDPESVSLLETLLEAAATATEGAASFAWATLEGLDLFLADEASRDLLRSHRFHLIVGVDLVTTEGALQRLGEFEAQFPGLRASVFLTTDRDGLFHPKTTWFRKETGGTVVVGSGNLTGGGLRHNLEFFSVTEFDADGFACFTTKWDAWVHSRAGSLVAVDDEEALARARRNRVGGWTPRGGRRQPDTVDRELEVLIAEIPRGGNRWNQANFDRENYEVFFGAEVGTQRRMLFQVLREEGTWGPLESRPSVEVASHNWRFELEAAAGLDYPDVGRPIGVFLRHSPRNFAYQLSMPGDPHYDELSTFLDDHWTGRVDRIRRVRTTVDNADLQPVHDLVAALPTSSFEGAL